VTIVYGVFSGTTFFDLSNYSLLFVILHLGLGFALLANVNFQLVWTNTVSDIQFDRAGLSPFNTTLLDEGFDVLPSFFWANFPSVFTDTRYVTSIPPYSNSCKVSPSCTSYFFPGGVYTLRPAPNKSDDSLVVYDAPGTQIEFYPINNETDTSNLLASDCHVYGYLGQAIQLCLRSQGNEYIAGSSWFS
jgi:hypothetical protein